MAVIWQSSEFWLMIGAVLLLIVGCTVLRNHTPFIATDSPHDVTLLDTPFPTFSPLNITITPTDLTTTPLWLNQLYERSIEPPPDAGIFVDVPQCYSLSGGQYSCLGQIWNYSENNLGDTRLQLAFFAVDGTKIREEFATTEQRFTPSGSFAPYRAIITGILADETRILPSINRTLVPIQNIQALSITEARGMITESGRYSLTVTILNDSGFVAQNIRLFTTLDDPEWGIVGYSVHEVENTLQNGEQQLIQLEVIPHALPDEIQHTVHVEATLTE